MICIRDIDHSVLRVADLSVRRGRHLPQLAAHGVKTGATARRNDVEGESLSMYIDPEGNIIECRGRPT